jgi:hypothetical protein
MNADPVGRKCRNCGETIPKTKKADSVFCSVECRVEKYNENCKYNPIAPQSFIGAVNELIVCADLLAKQYHVFRNISPHGPCDIIILKGEKCFRVEVKTGRMRPNGRLSHSPISKNQSYDILAVVLDGKVIYLNELP